MDTIKQLQKIILETIKASRPCDVRYATITKLNPLTITLQNTQLIIEAPAVTQLECTKELTMDNPEHTHQYFDSDTGDGASGSQTRQTEKALSNFQCYLGGQALGKTQDGKIIIRKGLATGDKVAVIRVSGGQEYLIIGRA